MAGLRIPHDCIVLVGDGEKALFFRNKGDEDLINLVVEREFDADLSIGGGGRNAEASEEERTEEAAFAHCIAKALYKGAHAGKYDRLVIVSPPKILGALRKEMHKEVEDRLIGELAKTLTSRETPEIERLLTARD